MKRGVDLGETVCEKNQTERLGIPRERERESNTWKVHISGSAED